MFVPVIEEVPDEVEVFESDEDWAVVIPLAASEDGYRLVALETRLLPYDNEHELKFCIAVLDEDTGEPFRIFDRDMAAGYIPPQVRDLVMPCVLVSVDALTRAVQPQVIYRVTHATHPDDKALGKHQMITERLVGLGLRVQESGTDRFGRQFWRMARDGGENGWN